MAKLKGKKKAAFLRRMKKGRLKKQRKELEKQLEREGNRLKKPESSNL